MNHIIHGREMQQRLEQAGIPVRRVIRKRDSGCYVADFYEPNLQQPVPPAQSWARLLEQRLGGRVRVLHLNDTRADWRPGRPVIAASVTFTLVE